jgi:hypothetical protein
MSEAGPLIELVARIIETHRDPGRIGPTWVAIGGMVELDPLKAVEKFHPLTWLGCHLEQGDVREHLVADQREEQPGASDPLCLTSLDRIDALHD